MNVTNREFTDMASNCYMSVFTAKANTIGYCVQQAIQHVVRAPRLAAADEWFTTVISVGLAILCAMAILSVFIAFEAGKHNGRRRFT
jgi:F0F1-type ATP synthase membrane subunit c/vacuolar-type H+-ATPase subunit K